jgi:hypothetical protein
MRKVTRGLKAANEERNDKNSDTARLMKQATILEEATN